YEADSLFSFKCTGLVRLRASDTAQGGGPCTCGYSKQSPTSPPRSRNRSETEQPNSVGSNVSGRGRERCEARTIFRTEAGPSGARLLRLSDALHDCAERRAAQRQGTEIQHRPRV